MRIWVSTENSRGPEIRPDGGRRDTSSFQAGFKLTEEKGERKKTMILKNGKGTRGLVGCEKHGGSRSKNARQLCFHTLTGEDNEENDCDVDEEELEVPKVTEDLNNKSRQTSLETCHLNSNLQLLDNY